MKENKVMYRVLNGVNTTSQVLRGNYSLDNWFNEDFESLDFAVKMFNNIKDNDNGLNRGYTQVTELHQIELVYDEEEERYVENMDLEDVLEYYLLSK